MALGDELPPPGGGRCDVPRSAVAHFLQPEVAIPLEAAARLLGFASVQEMRKGAMLKQFEDQEPLGPAGTKLGAERFVRLLLLCAGRTAAARRIFDELARHEVVDLPAAIVPREASLPRFPLAQPEAVGLDKAPLERVRAYLTWRCGMRHLAGITCGVVRHGKLAFFQESGFSDAEAKVRMTGDTIVRLFSMTKCLVAAAFMTFLEEPDNGIDLDDPVSKYIPAFAAAQMTVLPKRGQKENQRCEAPITLRQLLTHTSGIGYGATLDDPWPPAKGSYYKIYEELSEKTLSGEISSLEAWCNELAKVPLKGQPGRYWDYGYSLDILGRVLEVVAGKPLDVLVEERICGPLKMRDTAFSVPQSKASRIGPWYKSVEIEGKPNLAHRLEVVDRGGEQSGWVGANAARVLSGGGTVDVPLSMKGGMVSTFNDYLRFLMMLRNFGELDGVRVLRRETVQMMVCNHIPASCYGKKNVFVFDKYGLGFSCLGQIQAQHQKMDRGTYPGEYGWGGLAGPAWTIDPRADLIVLSMTQTAFVLDHEEYLRYAARRAIHQHIFGSVAGPAKATSYSPECFDVVRPKPVQEPSAGEEQASMDKELDKEFEQEHLFNAKTRIRGAKEQAICPGPRLDRHPSDEDSRDGGAEEEAEKAAPLGKRRRTSAAAASGAAASPASAEAGTPAASPPIKRTQAVAVRQVVAATSPSKPVSKVQSSPQPAPPAEQRPTPPSEQRPEELLFSRVCVRSDDVEEATVKKKARVTAVEDNGVEVVTEGSWATMNVSMSDISVIDETQLGSSPASADGPSDFGFLMADRAAARGKGASSPRRRADARSSGA